MYRLSYGVIRITYGVQVCSIPSLIHSSSVSPLSLRPDEISKPNEQLQYSSCFVQWSNIINKLDNDE